MVICYGSRRVRQVARKRGSRVFTTRSVQGADMVQTCPGHPHGYCTGVSRQRELCWSTRLKRPKTPRSLDISVGGGEGTFGRPANQRPKTNLHRKKGGIRGATYTHISGREVGKGGRADVTGVDKCHATCVTLLSVSTHTRGFFVCLPSTWHRKKTR